MGRLVLYTILASTGLASLLQPWVGIAVSYLFIILTPQNIWYWNFEGVRPVFWILLPTGTGVIIGLLNGNLSLALIWNKKNLWIFLLWGCFCNSYFFGPYIGVNVYRFNNVHWVFSLVNNIFILYFMACVCVDNTKKVKLLAWVMCVSVIYMIYWINNQYLLHGYTGRMGGPSSLDGQSIYRDENGYAMLFVAGLPFLYYLGLYSSKKLLRYSLWLIVPFGWHAIFLTGSRGGLLGLIAIILIVCFCSKKRKIITFLVVPAFLVAFYWQAGPIMKDRAETINDFQQEESAVTRLEAWAAGMKMIVRHPLTGVGLGSFGPAFSDHSDKQPREAHNTFIQITAESGVIAGLAYVMIIWHTVQQLRQNNKWFKYHQQNMEDSDNLLFLLNQATFVSISGMIICSMFLSLQVYEIFYFLLLIVNSITFIVRQKKA